MLYTSGQKISRPKFVAPTGIKDPWVIDPRSGNPPSVTLAALRKLAAGLEVPLETLINVAQNDNGGAVLPIEVTEPKTAAARLVKGEDIVMVPVIDELTAGQESLKDMKVVGQCPIDAVACNIAKDEVNNYYSLNISDDSMAPNICPGDRVIIKQGPVEDGQVGAIICAGEKGVIRKINFASELNIPDQIGPPFR